MLRILGRASRTLSWLTGGEDGQTLCARIAQRFGPDCLFCKVVGWTLREPQHCAIERVDWILHKHRKGAKNDPWL